MPYLQLSRPTPLQFINQSCLEAVAPIIGRQHWPIFSNLQFLKLKIFHTCARPTTAKILSSGCFEFAPSTFFDVVCAQPAYHVHELLGLRALHYHENKFSKKFSKMLREFKMIGGKDSLPPWVLAYALAGCAQVACLFFQFFHQP